MKKLYEEAAVQDIADAIREKTGGAETYKIAQMGGAVRSIPTAIRSPTLTSRTTSRTACSRWHRRCRP